MSEERPMIYLASPYYHEDADIRQQRYEAIKAITAELTEIFTMFGITFFSPIVYGHTLDAACERNVDWYAISREFLKRCDYMIIVPLDDVDGSHQTSKGIQSEIETCEALDIPYEVGMKNMVGLVKTLFTDY